MNRLELYDGKYTVINELGSGGRLYALRYGEEWRSLAGDNLVLAMFHKIEELSGKLSEAESLLSEAHDLLDDVHCYDTETYEAISRYFNGGDDE